MPPMLYKGQDAEDVAAYVRQVAAIPGQDTGALATAVRRRSRTPRRPARPCSPVSAAAARCHTLAAAGTTGTVGPNLDKRLRTNCATPQSKKIRGATLEQCITTAITKPYAYLPSGYAAGVMPNTFSKTLSPSQIQALVTFLSSATK